VTRRRFPRPAYRRRRRVSWRFRVAAALCLVALFLGVWRYTAAVAGGWAPLVDVGFVGFIVAAVYVRFVRPVWRRWRTAHPRYREANLSTIDRMTGPQFERHIAGLLIRDGWERVTIPGGAGDLGADVVAYHPTDGLKLVVQCKRYRVTRPVGSADMQRFLGTVRLVHRADYAWFVTTSRFTDAAAELAAAGQVVPLDREALADWSSRMALTAA